MPELRIIFMGTPEFAVASLDALIQNAYNVCAVVTGPDRPAGRGQRLRQSAVKQYALEQKLEVLQPENLKSPDFHDQLRSYEANLFIVVAFRMLPELVWSMPALGTFNLHASLLPQYRGAAPINRAIMNGETRGGVSTFFLRHEIDTGNIIFREETDIPDDETAGEYHDRLMNIGGGLVIKTVKAIEAGTVETSSQDDLINADGDLKLAPKISKEDCRIHWNRDVAEVFNLIRGLSPYPGAFAEIKTKDGALLFMKIFKADIKYCSCNRFPGKVKTDYKTYLKICCNDGCISVLELQQAGKKRMKIKDFLVGLIPNSLA